ncbi:MAG TPA: hypothetical protein VLD60_08950 [Nitrospira sp.]|nr:hypothetical protein [Nitrospira sp.]
MRLYFTVSTAPFLIGICLCVGCGVLTIERSVAQVMGDAAEMDRLRVKAEEAIGNDDPEGAAMNMGRAALMAKRLGLLNKDDNVAIRLYRGAESLFRSQEHGYRAMALFRRAGGQLPASSGVCGSLALAQGNVQHALSDLAQEILSPPPLAERWKRWRETADDWVIVVASMITDYQCP